MIQTLAVVVHESMSGKTQAYIFLLSRTEMRLMQADCMFWVTVAVLYGSGWARTTCRRHISHSGRSLSHVRPLGH